MKLGRQVGFGAAHIVIDGDTALPSLKGADPPIFGPCLLWPNGCMDQDATWYGGRPQPRPPPQKWGTATQFLAHACCAQTAGWIKMPLAVEVSLNPSDSVLYGDPALPPEKGA